ncbi:putative reverse transcriptase domain-containing protein [Tanacetum coccineum]
MTIVSPPQSGVRGMILATQGEAFKQENVLTEKLHGLDQQMEKKEDEMQKALGTRLDMSTAYHPQTDGQSERTTLIQTGGYFNVACVIDFGGRPFYGWKLVKYFDRPALVQKTIERKKGKLAPRYVELFEILERIGSIAYQLRLPQELSSMHDTFHVSNLNNCLADASLHVSLDEIKVDKALCFVEEPVEIMDQEVRSLKHSKISLVKVRWNSKRGPEFTWEREDHMKSKYP